MAACLRAECRPPDLAGAGRERQPLAPPRLWHRQGTGKEGAGHDASLGPGRTAARTRNGSGLTPEGAAALIAAGLRVTVEESSVRAIADRRLPRRGLRDRARERLARRAARRHRLRAEGAARGRHARCGHRHIMFGHAYKGQPAGQVLLRRFAGRGRDALRPRISRRRGRPPGRRLRLLGGLCRRRRGAEMLGGAAARADRRPGRAISRQGRAAGRAYGRAGRHRRRTGPDASSSARWAASAPARPTSAPASGVEVTKWDMAETAHGGPFPEVLRTRDLPQLHPRPPRHARSSCRPRRRARRAACA